MSAANVRVVVGAWAEAQVANAAPAAVASPNGQAAPDPIAAEGPGSLMLEASTSAQSEALEVRLVPDLAERNGRPGEYKKVSRQQAALAAAGAPLYEPGPADPSAALSALNYTQLDHLPDWAHRRYQVALQPLGGSIPADTIPFQDFIYLFNVLVALEWEPDNNDLQQLRWAFRRASDFLFDVTNGWMAFGQVVIGGPELMEAADIQIMASNRIHPRSWVGGMSDNVRNMPIRTGRGLWHDRQQFAIPWEEPEAFRILIHEWGHYALDLIDEYPSPPSKHGSGSAAFSVVIPELMPGKESIMAGTTGVSELNSNQWERLNRNFPEIDSRRERRDGPQQLAGDLPRFYLTREQSMAARPATEVFFPSWRQDAYAEIRHALSGSLDAEHSWIYLLREVHATPDPRRQIISQGTLDSRWRRADAGYPGYRLLGAQEHDQVILISSQPNAELQILQGVVRRTDRKLSISGWATVTPDQLPIIDVIPEIGAAQPVPVRVRVSDPAVTEVSIFPFGQAGAPLARDAGRSTDTLWVSGSVPVATLDGHVLVQIGDRLAITSFSQGGGPPFHTPGPANPITAGSSDGSAMIFFYSGPLARDDQSEAARAEAERYSQTKVVTTRIHGAGYALPSGMKAASYAFSIASNQQLTGEIVPTLVLYYDLSGEKGLEQGDVRLHVCRLEQQAGVWAWAPQATTIAPFGSSFAAIPLYARPGQHPGGTLVADAGPEPLPRVEYYMVCWT